ncbi:transcription termination factor 5, mitochondrial isoform X1 [Osmia bicornis bicornis]|uniref:transcription termination factor 5, mitochondrial isoform X1 n=1 Tax=Osmia bicornis bicornis TaxID=1437191 RepID=UPI0010F46BE2|nr:transcription termination factor 5, mitochondrial isoform X1 [Osmia bicornis bicornis]
MFKLLSPRKFIQMCLRNQFSLLSTQANDDNVLITHLNIDRDAVKRINQSNKNNISKIPKEKLIENCVIIKELDVNLTEIQYLESCLVLHPTIIKSRILLLKEMGVKDLGLHHIHRFPSSMRRSVKQFKKIHSISPKENIMQNIINNIGLTIDESSLNKFDHSMKTSNFYALCMAYYKTFYLQLYNKAFYENKRQKYQSFQELGELLNIFQTKYHFDHKFLSKYPYLLSQDKNNIEQFLTEFKDTNIVNNKSIIEIAKEHPRILCYPTAKVKELLILCKKLDIPVQSIISYICTLRLEKGVFLDRYINILNNYELSTWSKHPRMLNLIYFYNTAITRIEYLKLCNRMSTANVHTFLSDGQFFMRYVRGDLCHMANRKFLLYILCKELGKDKVSLINRVAKHKHWKNVSLLVIVKTIEYLKRHYSLEDICKNIHIVLYPESTISEATNIIDEEFTPEKGYHFTSSQRLALCLYIIERKYHFNGDAVWQGIDTQVSVFENLEKDEYEIFIENLSTNDKALHDLNGIAWLEYLLQ